MLKRLIMNQWLAIGLGLLLLPGCYPSESFTVQELDLVVTNYDVDEDYGRFLTFAVPDSIVRNGGDGSEEEGPFDDLILDLVRENMRDAGYQEELDPENNIPDLVVLVEILVVDNTVVAPCYPGWGWWYWPPYWGPGWCGGWPWVPVGSYTTGTVTMNMVDVDGADMDDETFPIIWNGILNGLVTGDEASGAQRVTEGIDQAFIQSPYLGR